MEVGCLGTWGLELPTPNPGGKNTPKACPSHNPATSPARPAEGPPGWPSPERWGLVAHKPQPPGDQTWGTQPQESNEGPQM